MFAERDDGLEKIRLEKLRCNVLSVREAEKAIMGAGGGNWEPVRKLKGRIRF